MAKLIVLGLCAVITGVLAEPPSSYLPPQARNSLSNTYGAPNGGFRSAGKASSFHSQRNGVKSFSYNSLHENQFGSSQTRKTFSGSGKFRSSNGFNGAVSQQYGAPSFGASSAGFGGNGGSNGFGVSQQYGAPSFGASSAGFGGNGGSNGFGVSQQYGPPSSRSSGITGAKFGASRGSGFAPPAPAYGPPSSGYGASSKAEDDLAEPPNYEYTYEVQAAEESGAEFGHQESREDEAARGVYHVLLPDGRTQIVEYEADDEGFRPNIRYEESGGYPAARGGQGPY